MIRKLISSIIVIVTIIISMNLFTNKIYAADSVDDIFEGAQDFLDEGSKTEINTGVGQYNVQNAKLNEAKLKDASDFIFNLLLAIAIVLAVIIGIVIGIKFMTSSVEEKAQIKEALVPYVIGCTVVFGAFGIWKLAITILSEW